VGLDAKCMTFWDVGFCWPAASERKSVIVLTAAGGRQIQRAHRDFEIADA